MGSISIGPPSEGPGAGAGRASGLLVPSIDCTYVNITGPRIHEEADVNHWGDHALNVQVVRTRYT